MEVLGFIWIIKDRSLNVDAVVITSKTFSQLYRYLFHLTKCPKLYSQLSSKDDLSMNFKHYILICDFLRCFLSGFVCIWEKVAALKKMWGFLVTAQFPVKLNI